MILPSLTPQGLTCVEDKVVVLGTLHVRRSGIGNTMVFNPHQGQSVELYATLCTLQ